jgi:hypothetical protein
MEESVVLSSPTTVLAAAELLAEVMLLTTADAGFAA